MNESELKKYLLKENLDFKKFEAFMIHKTVLSTTLGENFYFKSDIELFLNTI